MSRNYFFQLSVFCLIWWHMNAVALAGGWVSSGGEITRFESVPWLLGYDRQVQYCIEKDDAAFSQPLEFYDRLFLNAVGYWKTEMSIAIIAYETSDVVNTIRTRINSHEYVRVPCSDSVQIRLQLGVLSEEQQEFLRDPTKYVAVAVRTDLIEETLEAKGFIYISPTTGSLAMDLGDQWPIPWDYSEGASFEKVIAHELGHIYGLRHQGQPNELMSSRFPESIVTGLFNKFPVGVFPDFFRYRNLFEVQRGEPRCATEELSGQLRVFFAIPHNVECITFEPFQPGLTSSFRVVGLRGGAWEHIGSISPRYQEGGYVQEFGGGATFHLPKEQTVFPLGYNVLAARITEDVIVGTYVPSGSLVSRDIVLTVRPGRLSIVGTMNERIFHITTGQ